LPRANSLGAGCAHHRLAGAFFQLNPRGLGGLGAFDGNGGGLV